MYSLSSTEFKTIAIIPQYIAWTMSIPFCSHLVREPCTSILFYHSLQRKNPNGSINHIILDSYIADVLAKLTLPPIWADIETFLVSVNRKINSAFLLVIIKCRKLTQVAILDEVKLLKGTICAPAGAQSSQITTDSLNKTYVSSVESFFCSCHFHRRPRAQPQ